MSRITIATLLAAFAIFTSPNRTGHSKTHEAAQGETTTIKVYLSGLMVFHKEKDKDRYEVGILKNAHHTFKVLVGPITIPLESADSWTLQVKPGSTVPSVTYEVGHGNKRRPDHPTGQWDFSWIIDLENEFHPGSNFELIPGKLKPIIHLPGGRFHTAYKSMDLMRWQGKDVKNATNFGFVPETIILELVLSDNQELVLKNDATGNEHFLARHSSGPSKGAEVFINNHAHQLNAVSDFYLYYQLFKNPPPADRQYKFKANKDPKRPHPLNPYPGYVPSYDKKTCCGMVCTAVLLGERVKALE